MVATAVLVALSVSACAGKRKKPTLAYEERPVELLYSTGANRLDRGSYNEAVDYFREVERQHPYSEWSRRSILMTGYAHYMSNQYNEAISDADRFIGLYPGNPSASYAYYLKAVCYFEQIVDVNRDQAATEQAMASLRDVVQRYPNSEYAQDARLKIDMVSDQLAGKEMTIGRYYLKNGQTLAAIGRFRTVVDRHQTTSHTPEALYRLVESYLTLGLLDEAKRNGAVLGYNFPGDPWYAEAYKLLTANNLKPAVEPLKAGNKKNILDRLTHDKDTTMAPPSEPKTSGETATTAEAKPGEAATPPAPAKPKKGGVKGLLGM
jgi:outer membrane protein assembly factor BamD